MNTTKGVQRYPIQSVLDNISDAVILTSEAGIIEVMNPPATRLSEAFPKLAIGSDILDADAMFRAVKTQSGCTILPNQKSILDTPNGYPATNGQGKKRILSVDRKELVDTDKIIIGYLWIIKEISELVQIRNELQKTQAFESIGFLAAGVAHDFNNLLSGVFGFIDLAYQTIDKPAECAEFLQNARKVVHRARDLTSQLLTLSKGGSVQKRVTSIAGLLEDSFRICTMGAPVKKEIIIQNDLWNCNIDQGQVSQALNNILINAIQSMPSGGSLEVEASNVELANNEVASLPQGHYVKISIRDTGPGISPEIINNIFDPYFTTKDKGSGIGLAVAWSVIKRQQGHIDVHSRPGIGSTFIVYIPASFGTVETASSNESNKSKCFRPLRVIVMDDDPILRHVFEKMISKYNCEVTTVVSGEHALQTLRDAYDRNIHYDAALLDLTIPGGKGGKEIVGEVTRLFPDIKTIAISGYTGDPIFDNPVFFGFQYSLTKPFLTDELFAVLSAIADD